jgi:N-dimethylarginine dimethylaminohydrolase
MTDTAYMGVAGINPYENVEHAPDKMAAGQQLLTIQDALKKAGITVIRRPSPAGQQDAVYTANWAVTWKGRAIMSKLPDARAGEEAAAEQYLKDLRFDTRRPGEIFSGQGDTLIFNDSEAIVGNGYRTKITTELLDQFTWLGINPVIVKTKPRRLFGWLWALRNPVTGLPDSFYYDIDLAVAVIAPNVLAVCWAALTRSGRRTMRTLQRRADNKVIIIPVSKDEALRGFACNLVSTGRTVIMPDGAPKLAARLGKLGYDVVPVNIDQFRLTGGGVRCVTLTLNK